MQHAFQSINWLAVLLSAVSAFVLGGLWYSPLLFAKRWMKETGITEETTKNANMVKIFGLGFILAFIASFFLAMFIGPAQGAAFDLVLLPALWPDLDGYSRSWESVTCLNPGHSCISLSIQFTAFSALP